MSNFIYLILVLWITESSCSLSLTSNPTIIGRNGTENLTLTCLINERNKTYSDDSSIEVSRMRILKLNVENTEWNPVIEMERTWKSPNVMDSLEGSVSVDENGINHLQVTWPLATDVTTGQYTCDIIGYTHYQQPVGQRSLPIILDMEEPLTLYQVYSMLKTSEKKVEQSREKISTNEENIEQSQKTLDVLKSIFIEQWPHGSYGLLQPESGCPADVGVVWKMDYITHFTENQERNEDEVSVIAHMKKPFMWTKGTAKLMRQYHCNVDIQSTGRLWPSGSYCINNVVNSYCPLGFKIGKILWDEEDTNTAYDSIMLAYCCRSDSDPQTPIELPRRKPFYLYRYGGTCQAVTGMKVTPEYMYFDTKCCKSRFDDFAPDGANALPDVKLHLCYYENPDQSQKTQDAMTSNYFGQWPEGVYALLQPESGCPHDLGVVWKTGSRTHQTSHVDGNKDEVSTPAHMHKPIMWNEGNVYKMRQHFCSVDQKSTGRLWPAGSYCVIRYKDSECPQGFDVGNIYWDDYSAGPLSYYGMIPATQYDGNTRIYYCCRYDSSPHSPIQLPKLKPFYLYRYGGTCQEVTGMKVTPEYMFFDADCCSSRYNNFAPDGGRLSTRCKTPFVLLRTQKLKFHS